jgi:hypothetical protein
MFKPRTVSVTTNHGKLIAALLAAVLVLVVGTLVGMSLTPLPDLAAPPLPTSPLLSAMSDVPGVRQAGSDGPIPGPVLGPIAPLPDQKAQPKPQTVESPPFGPPPAPEPLAPNPKLEAPEVEPKGTACATPCNPQPWRRRWFRR